MTTSVLLLEQIHQICRKYGLLAGQCVIRKNKVWDQNLKCYYYGELEFRAAERASERTLACDLLSLLLDEMWVAAICYTAEIQFSCFGSLSSRQSCISEIAPVIPAKFLFKISDAQVSFLFVFVFFTCDDTGLPLSSISKFPCFFLLVLQRGRSKILSLGWRSRKEKP